MNKYLSELLDFMSFLDSDTEFERNINAGACNVLKKG